MGDNFQMKIAKYFTGGGRTQVHLRALFQGHEWAPEQNHRR